MQGAACRGWGWAGSLVDAHSGSSSLLGGTLGWGGALPPFPLLSSSVAFFLRHTRVSLHSLLGASGLLPAPWLPLTPVLPAPPWIGVSPASSGSLVGKLGLTREPPRPAPHRQLKPFWFLKKCRQIQWNSPSQSSHPEQDSC